MRRNSPWALLATALLPAFLGLLPLGVAEAAPEAAMETRRTRQLMGTLCAVTLEGSEAPEEGSVSAGLAAAALDRIAEVEAVLSTWREDSELSLANRGAAAGPVRVGPELMRFLDETLRLAQETDGAFDPSVGALITAWDLRGEGRVPSGEELHRARAATGHEKVRLEPTPPILQFDAPGLWIDAGGVGKGFALDRAAEVIRRAGVNAALLDFGGQILALGSPRDQDAWSVAVAAPDRRDQPALVLGLRNQSAATSSQSERTRTVQGRRIGHILDPRDGMPVDRAGSVTVVADSATKADALATALFVLGPENGLRWVRDRPYGVGFLEPVPGSEPPRYRLRANPAFSSLVIARRGFVEVVEPDPHESGFAPGSRK